MGRVEVYVDPSGKTFGYVLTGRNGEHVMEGDGYESREEIFSWFEQLNDTLADVLSENSGD